MVQIDPANAVSPHTIIVPFTSKIKKVVLPCHVFVPANVGGLSQNSVILCEQIRVIDKSRIIKIIGKLPTNYLNQLDQALGVILGLNLAK